MTYDEEVAYLAVRLKEAMSYTDATYLTPRQAKSVSQRMTKVMEERCIETITSMEVLGMIEIALTTYPEGIEHLKGLRDGAVH